MKYKDIIAALDTLPLTEWQAKTILNAVGNAYIRTLTTETGVQPQLDMPAIAPNIIHAPVPVSGEVMVDTIKGEEFPAPFGKYSRAMGAHSHVCMGKDCWTYLCCTKPFTHEHCPRLNGWYCPKCQ